MQLLADLLAVLAMTMSKRGSHEILLFKKQGTMQDLGSWGHEFVRALAGEVGAEYSASQLVDKFDGAEMHGMESTVHSGSDGHSQML